jgi:hypothetical protein
METTEKNIKPNNNNKKEKAIISWSAFDILEHSRGWKYLICFTTFFVVLISYFAYTRDWFAVIILILLPALILYYQKNRKPETKNYTITDLGIHENELFYPYNEIYSFWLNINKDFSSLNIIFSKKYLPQLTIFLKDIDPSEVKTALLKHIPEEATRTESWIDKTARWLKI